MKRIILMLVIMFLSTLSYAKNISNLDTVIAKIKKSSKVSVVVPATLPDKQETKIYFASADLAAQQVGIDYSINFSAIEDCNGAKYCNLGYIRAESNKKPEWRTDRSNKKITIPVQLSHNIKGYYTPGHAAGDYWPADIQWSMRGVLYTLSWDTDKNTLIKMANSAITDGAH